MGTDVLRRVLPAHANLAVRCGTYLLAVALDGLTGLNLATLIILCGIVITIYPFFGGTEGVIWTGVVQTAVLVSGRGAASRHGHPALGHTGRSGRCGGNWLATRQAESRAVQRRSGNADLLGNIDLRVLHESAELRHRSKLCATLSDRSK